MNSSTQQMTIKSDRKSSHPMTIDNDRTLDKPKQTRRLRVCHVSMSLETGGLERLLVEFGKRFDAERYDLQFVALDRGGAPAEELRQAGFPVTTLACSEKNNKRKLFSALSKLFREQQIEVVHSHNTYAHFYASIAGRWAGVPIILNTQHGRGCGNHWKQRLHFWLANCVADQVLAVSEDSTRICRQQDRWGANKILPLWNGIDLDRFAYHGPAATLDAISVARLSPEKDFPTLIQAVSRVVEKYPDFRLTIVGAGKERERLEELCHQLQMTNIITFLGERHDIPELLKRAAFFVSSSSTEGISLTLLEAMAVGLPIVTTNVGGNPEIVDQEATGYLVPAGNPQALATAICTHLSQPDTWSAMGQLARVRVEEKFHIQRMIQQYADLYDQWATRKITNSPTESSVR